ncbi:hypothetical protein FRC16_008991, partial [Serendipita sp. 398]
MNTDQTESANPVPRCQQYQLSDLMEKRKLCREDSQRGTISLQLLRVLSSESEFTSICPDEVIDPICDFGIQMGRIGEERGKRGWGMPPLGYLAHKANESYKLSQKWQDNPLKGELEAIREEVFNQCLANLFAQTVRELVEESDKWWSFGRLSTHLYDLDRIEPIVLRVKEQVFEVEKDNESYLKHGKILQEGMGDLKTFVTSSRRLVKLEKDEAEAVQQDQQRHESTQHQPNLPPSLNSDTRIQAYLMEHPDGEPYILPPDPLIVTYNDIRHHLCVRRIVRSPDLWA